MEHRRRLANPSHGSRTLTLLESQPEASGSNQPDSAAEPAEEGVLRLRRGPRSAPRVQWNDDVIDNEGCGKKKSKICCIYHKPKKFDESSDESSDESDSECDEHDPACKDSPSSKRKAQQVDSSGSRPNAYEAQPPTRAKGKQRTLGAISSSIRGVI